MNVQTYNSYRSYLSDVMQQRSHRNSGYSLRAFARDLGISPAMLSEVLQKKKRLSLKTAFQVCSSIGLNTTETSYFCDLVEAEDGRDLNRHLARIRVEGARRQHNSDEVSIEVFQALSSWLHFVVLELASAKDCPADPKHLARRLGVSTLEVRRVIDRLVSLGVIERTEDTLTRAKPFIASPSDTPSEALRQLTADFLERAIDELHKQPVAKRDYSTTMMRLNPEQLPQLKEEFRDLRRKIVKKYEAERGLLYCLSTQLFQLEKEIDV